MKLRLISLQAFQIKMRVTYLIIHRIDGHENTILEVEERAKYKKHTDVLFIVN